MVEARTALGSYLLTKRLSRDGDSVAQYLNKYGVTDVLSESYYRDIETGRKQIRVQSAEELCEKLDLDRRSFYYYLLKDIIPDDVFQQIVSMAAIDTFRSASERAEKLGRSNREYGEAILALAADDITDLSDSAIDVLEKDRALLAVLHFVYNRNECNYREIDIVYNQCGGIGSIAENIVNLLGDHVVEVDYANKMIRRRSATIRVPNSTRGQIFKNTFTEYEIRRSLQKKKTNHLKKHDGTLQYSVIVPLAPDTVRAITVDGVSRLIASIQSDGTSLENDDSRPFYVGIVVSSRDEYNVSQHGQGKDLK